MMQYGVNSQFIANDFHVVYYNTYNYDRVNGIEVRDPGISAACEPLSTSDEVHQPKSFAYCYNCADALQAQLPDVPKNLIVGPDYCFCNGIEPDCSDPVFAANNLVCICKADPCDARCESDATCCKLQPENPRCCDAFWNPDTCCGHFPDDPRWNPDTCCDSQPDDQRCPIDCSKEFDPVECCTNSYIEENLDQCCSNQTSFGQNMNKCCDKNPLSNNICCMEDTWKCEDDCNPDYCDISSECYDEVKCCDTCNPTS